MVPKPYEHMDDLGVFKNHPYFWFNTHINIYVGSTPHPVTVANEGL